MATALLKLTQGAVIGDGEAIKGVASVAVDVENSDNTGVKSWRIDLVYTPPGSTLPIQEPLALNANDSTPYATFTPDGVPGCCRLVLKVYPEINYGGDENVDIRNFALPEPVFGFVYPPYQALPPKLPVLGSGAPNSKPDELNFGGQAYGWDGEGDEGLLLYFMKQVASKLYKGGFRRRTVINLVDCTAAPPTTSTGDRYILDFTGGSVHAGWDGASKGDIVEKSATVWVAESPEEGWVAYVDVPDKDGHYVDDGVPAWDLRPAYSQLHADLTDTGTDGHPESANTYDDSTGHDHQGSGNTGKQISHASTTGQTADDHHAHVNKTELDLVSDGDHDVRSDNPHSVTAGQAGASPTGHTHTHASTTGQGTDNHHARDHAATHGPSAADALRLDDLEEPEDNTDLDVDSSRHGLAPKLPDNATVFLDGAGDYSFGSGGWYLLPAGEDLEIPQNRQLVVGGGLDSKGSLNIKGELVFLRKTSVHHFRTDNPHSVTAAQAGAESIKTEMHKVTAGEVTAGFFTLAASPVNAQSVRLAVHRGLNQANKQIIGATGATPDFDVLSTNQLHINNNGAATGLSEDIVEDDVLILAYQI